MEPELEHVDCDLCGKDDSRPVFEGVTDSELGVPGAFDIVACNGCGLIYLNPRVPPADVHRYYPPGSYGPYQRENPLILALKHWFWRRDKRSIEALIGSSGAILEVGCARGDFLNSLSNGYALYGLEPDATAAAIAAGRGRATVWQGSFEDFTFPPELRFDLVILAFVLEHLPSVRVAFEKLRRLGKAGSKLVITTANFDSWERKCFGRYWHCLDAPRHYCVLTEATFREYARMHGFSVLSVSYSRVPNDWIGGIGRFCRARGWDTLARFFNIRNRAVAAAFLPLSLLAGLCKRSSRFTFVLERDA